MTDTLYRKRGRRYEPVPDQLDELSCFMTTCAVRYCMGRSSYAPTVAMDWCNEHWGRLNNHTRHVIVRDVIQWLAERQLRDKHGSAHMENYRTYWRHFAQGRIDKEGDEWGRRVVRAALHSPEYQSAPEVAQFLKWIA